MSSYTSTADTPEASHTGSDMEFWQTRNLRFRVVILGCANAGKTTLLERLANASEEDAMIFREGKPLEHHESVCSKAMITFPESNSSTGDQGLQWRA
jgi:GTPase SAR1 family protein